MTDTTVLCGTAASGIATLADSSVDVCFADPPYNTGKLVSRLPTYDKSQSIQEQKWTDFNASWDAIQNYDQFMRDWLCPLRRVLKPEGSLFITGTFHNIPTVQTVLKALGFHVIQWIAWVKPNAFPNRELIQMTSANEVVIWARRDKTPRHVYNVERARDYAILDHWRQTRRMPRKRSGELNRTNLRDFWLISNDSRAVKQFPFLIHGAKKPPELVGRCIDIALPESGGLVIDPFSGTFTTSYVSAHLNDWIMTPRRVFPSSVGIDVHKEYARMGALRLEADEIYLDDARQLPDGDRADLRSKLGRWASYILDGVPDPVSFRQTMLLWDAERPTLKRPPISWR